MQRSIENLLNLLLLLINIVLGLIHCGIIRNMRTMTQKLTEITTTSLIIRVVHRDVNIEFFPNPDIECDNPVKVRISDFIRAA